MPKITVLSRSGESSIIDMPSGRSLMQAMRDGGVDELLAICGGSLSCATCHVYVDPAWFGRLPAPSGDEEALLDGPNRQPTSRLSCQLPITEELDGLKVTVAPED